MIEIGASDRVAKPPPLPGTGKFSADTRRWYRAWACSPQATLFGVTEWQRLHMLAHLVDRYYASPSPSVLAEIRANETKLGATPDDRLRLRWQVTADEPGVPAPAPSRTRDPRRRLTSV